MSSQAVLIGKNRSPYTRRVAITMNLYGIAFEQRHVTSWDKYEEIREANPIAKIPCLITEAGDCLIESAAILDYLDCRIGPERALMPPPSPLRDKARHIVALSTAIIDKGRELRYETQIRPQELRYELFVERWSGQLVSALTALDNTLSSPFAAGERLTQADVTAGVMYDMMARVHPNLLSQGAYPALDALAQRCRAMREFQRAKIETG